MAWAFRLRDAFRRFQMRRKTAGQPEIRQRIVNPWHAVSIVAGPYSCAAALHMRDTRMLSKEAPALPLPNCTMPRECVCRFQHHADRRAEPRRARDMGYAFNRNYSGAERRGESRGRRSTDIETMPFRR